MLEVCHEVPAQIEAEIRAAVKLQSSDPLKMIADTQLLLVRAEQIQSSRCIALACQVLGGAYRRANEDSLAESFLLRALAHAEENSTLAANIEIQLGALANEQRDFPDALHHLLIALEIHRERENKNGMAIVYFNLGNHFRLQQQNVTAREHYSKSITLYSQTNDEAGILLNLGALGYIARDRRDFKDAEFRFSTAQEILLRLKDRHNHAKLYIERAVLRVAEGDHSLARSYIRKAEQTARQIGMPAIFYNARILEAMIAFREKNDPAPAIDEAASVASEHNININLEELDHLSQLVLQDQGGLFMAMFEDRLLEKDLEG